MHEVFSWPSEQELLHWLSRCFPSSTILWAQAGGENEWNCHYIRNPYMATEYPSGLEYSSCQWGRGMGLGGLASVSPLPEITRAVWGGLGSQPKLPPWAALWRQLEVELRRLQRGGRPHPYLWRKRKRKSECSCPKLLLLLAQAFNWLPTSSYYLTLVRV